MDPTFEERTLKLDLKINLAKYSTFHIKKGESVYVHTLNGKPVTHFASYILDTELICILFKNQFINIQNYYLL